MFKFDTVQFAEGTVNLQICALAVSVLAGILIILAIAFLRSQAPLHCLLYTSDAADDPYV